MIKNPITAQKQKQDKALNKLLQSKPIRNNTHKLWTLQKVPTNVSIIWLS